MRHLRRLHAVEEQESVGARPQTRWGLLLGFAIAGVVLVALDVPVCPMANLMGLPCPGCGLTRASLALLRGDLSAAWQLHPAVFVALPALALALFRSVRPERSPSPTADRATSWAAGLVLAAMLALWLARFAGAFGGPVPVAGPVWSHGFDRTRSPQTHNARPTRRPRGWLTR